MAHSLLTPTVITRESLRILHQKLSFVGTIHREYDDQFAKSGGSEGVRSGKIGPSLKIRLPNEYTVTTGAVLSAQDVSEASETLTVSTQKHVGMNFTMSDLTLTIDDFSERYIQPAMSVLAASIEADAYSMYKDVYNLVDGDAVAIAFSHLLTGRRRLNENLAPMDNRRVAMLSPGHTATIVDALKGLFHQSDAIEQQYREGKMGKTAGFTFYENTHVADHTTGTAVKATGYLTNAATAQTGSTLVVDTGATTFLVGDVITIAGVNRVHPETKVSTGILQQFVITANSGANATSLSISPAITASGAKQNVTNGAADNSAIVKVGAAASELLNSSMVYHRDAFALATADLILPKGVDFAAREVMDGISMRIVRQYDIVNDKLPTRVDILYGYKTIRPQLACRIHADG